MTLLIIKGGIGEREAASPPPFSQSPFKPKAVISKEQGTDKKGVVYYLSETKSSFMTPATEKSHRVGLVILCEGNISSTGKYANGQLSELNSKFRIK